MYDNLIKDKIKDALKTNPIVNKLVQKLGSNVEEEIKKEIDDFLLSGKEIYQFSNFKDLMYQSFLELNDNRFANFIRNVVNNHPDKKRTYQHLLNDIQCKLVEKYELPKEYYRMPRNQLDNICDDLLLKEDYALLFKVRTFIKDNFRVFGYKTYIKENRDLAIKVLKRHQKDETNTNYIRIIKMLNNKNGLLGLFTYFHFQEKISLTRLRILLRTLNDNKNILRNLPQRVHEYMFQKLPYTINGRTYNTNFERLEDDLVRIIDINKAKIFASEYPSYLRKNLHTNDYFIELIRELSSDNEESKKKLEMYRTFFLKKVSRYKTQEELIEALMKFVMSSNDDEEIEKKVRNNSELKMVFNDGELMVIRVLSHDALQQIANDTSWCIKDSLSYWQDYVGTSNIQLVIIDLKQKSNSIYRKIGVTIYSNGSYYTGHIKNDNYISDDQINKILKEHDITLNEIFDTASIMGTNIHYSDYDIEEDERDRYWR